MQNTNSQRLVVTVVRDTVTHRDDVNIKFEGYVSNATDMAASALRAMSETIMELEEGAGLKARQDGEILAEILAGTMSDEFGEDPGSECIDPCHGCEGCVERTLH